MYETVFDEEAIEFLNKLPKEIKERIFKKIISTKENPLHFFERLTGRTDYKLRVGDYRVIADIDQRNSKIKVSKGQETSQSALLKHKKQSLIVHLRRRLLILVDLTSIKFCSLLSKSNPSIIEWLQADIVYYRQQPKGLRQIAFSEFSPLALFHHYKSMCRQNYEKYIKSGKQVTAKKYLYSMRGLVNAVYVERTKKLPLIQFPKMLRLCQGIIPQEIITMLLQIIERKKSGKEKEEIRALHLLNKYIESFLKQEGLKIPSSGPDVKKIDNELRQLVLSG